MTATLKGTNVANLQRADPKINDVVDSLFGIGLNPATLPLSGSETLYVIQNGEMRVVPASAMGSGGGGGGSTVTINSGTIVSGGTLDLVLSSGTTIAVVGSLTGPTGAQGVSVSTAAVAAGTLSLVLSNGTTIAATGGVTAGITLGILGGVPGVPTASEIISQSVVPFAFTIPTTPASHYFLAGTAATANANVLLATVAQNGTVTNCGTLQVAAAGRTINAAGSSITASGTYAAGTAVRLTAPSSVDATLADLSTTLTIIRQS